LPLDTKTQVILYFSRINCKEINPLVQEAFKLNKTLSRDGIYTWYTFAREILAEFDINEEDLFVLDKPFKLNIKNPIKNSTKRVVKEKYEQIILEKLSNLDENSKLFLYNKLKNEIKLEDYLSTLKNFNN
jgi:dTDP-4-dehydrorhamnose reductase